MSSVAVATTTVSKKRRGSVGVIIFGSLWLCGSLFITYSLGRSYFNQLHAANSYLPIAATSVSSEVISISRDEGGTSYTPIITYRYVVGGTTYESSRYHFMGRGAADYQEALEIARRYSPGAQLTAFYDPQNPTDAVLNRARPPFFFPFGVAILFVGFGLALIVSATLYSREYDADS